MKEPIQYPKRLIEVDLPIKRISVHARREKSIRHGHISTLHIWWARRPLAACRAVICAALWPDPADDLCPKDFRKAAAEILCSFAEKVRIDKQIAELCTATWMRWKKLEKGSWNLTDPKSLLDMRGALLDFIADFANWDASTIPAFLETARALTQSAHESLGGEKGTRPLVVDPFAGGGSIPLEALRVGADAFASDLNPVAVLLNKVVLEYIPKYGQRLADEVRKWGEWIKKEAEKELAEFYPKDPDDATPIAYLWARTIQCEGPGCGAEIPLVRSLWLAKKGNRIAALQLVPNPKAKRVDFQIIVKQRGGWVNQDNPNEKIDDPKFDGTVKRGSATCLCCGYTTPVARVREQLKDKRGGTDGAHLMCVVTTRQNEQGRYYRLPNIADNLAIRAATRLLAKRRTKHSGSLPLIPCEPLPLMSGVFNVPIYGHNDWGSLFTPRQAMALSIIVQLANACGENLRRNNDGSLDDVVKTIIALAVDREAEHMTSLCRWNASGQKMQATFGRQALPMVFDFCEANPMGNSVGAWDNVFECVMIPFETILTIHQCGTAVQSPAQTHPLPDDTASAFITDPPYYNAVPYADLSDFFYVWLRRLLARQYPDLFCSELTPKDAEACEMSGWDPVRYPQKNSHWYESEMRKAMSEGRRVLAPGGIGIVVFAHKTTAGWEAQLQSMIDAGWIITGSWPIDTEMGTRLRAIASAALASSVHLVCRPRENPDGTIRADEVGDWRDVLVELPRRIHEWMPRLAEEGVVGADAIFACLGPALEIFSRFSKVEKTSGEQVTLKEYLEHVWAAVSKEALTMIFEGADATGFEEDARLTAMWLWTLSTGAANGSGAEGEDGAESSEEDAEAEGKGGKAKLSGFVLEYDAARKIAQGLGAHLEVLTSLVEVKGDKARLLPVAERAAHLFGKEDSSAPSARKKKKKHQLTLGFIEEVEQAEESGGWGEKGVPKKADTVLDRVHQSMILFAAGRSEALKRFLIDEGVGRDEKFWRLAQALSALYPSACDEKRWVDGVMARKKGLGF